MALFETLKGGFYKSMICVLLHMIVRNYSRAERDVQGGLASYVMLLVSLIRQDISESIIFGSSEPCLAYRADSSCMTVVLMAEWLNG